jgi:hypothetical protein
VGGAAQGLPHDPARSPLRAARNQSRPGGGPRRKHIRSGEQRQFYTVAVAFASASAICRGDSRGQSVPRPETAAMMRLVSWRPGVKNSLRGFAVIELPNGLKIHEVAVLVSHGKALASMPPKPVLDRIGKRVELDGKRQYAPGDRSIANRFSNAVVTLVREAHPNALEDGDARDEPRQPSQPRRTVHSNSRPPASGSPLADDSLDDL